MIDITIEEIISRIDPVDVVSEYIELKKSGKNYMALCPFHPDKSPSFSFDPERGLFHCFGCGKSGNLVQFIMEIEGITFTDALKKLARKAGIQITPKKISERKTKVLEVIKWAKDFYHSILIGPEGEKARNYLKERKLTIGTIRNFEIGLATGRSDRLLKEARGKGIDPSLLMEAGLLTAGEGNVLRDFFRERIIFPIQNISGTYVGFGGRTVPWRNEEPKYLNSRETSYFNKSRILFGFFFTKENVKKQDSVIVVEGYMDLIRLYQEGFRNIVAPLGTSLTEEQCRIVSRYTKNIFLLFDNDPAGRTAMERAIVNLLKYGLKPRIVEIEENEDPDSFIEKYGKESLKEKIELSRNFLDVYMKLSRDPSETRKIIGKLLEFIFGIPDEIEREIYLSKIASFYTIPINALKSRVKVAGVQRRKTEKKVSSEWIIFLHILDAQANFSEVIRNIESDDFDDPLLKRIVEKMKKGSGFNDIITELEEKEREAIISSLVQIREKQRGTWEDACRKIEERRRKKKLKNLTRLLEQYEREGNKEKINQTLKEIQDLKNFKN